MQTSVDSVLFSSSHFYFHFLSFYLFYYHFFILIVLLFFFTFQLHITDGPCSQLWFWCKKPRCRCAVVSAATEKLHFTISILFCHHYQTKSFISMFATYPYVNSFLLGLLFSSYLQSMQFP